jgi:hypothetical protein
MKVTHIKKMIEEYGRVFAFWETFNCYPAVIGEEAWENAVEKLPEEIQEIVNQHGIETNLDWSSFGSASFFGSSIDDTNLSEQEQAILEDWKETHDKEYSEFLNALDAAMFAELQADPDLEDWKEAMKLAYTDEWRSVPPFIKK